MLRLLLLSSLLAGCAIEPYWSKTRDAYEVVGITALDAPALERMCGYERGAVERTIHGCTIVNTVTKKAMIFYRSHMSASDTACTLQHERWHARGWTHSDRAGFVMDCGPE